MDRNKESIGILDLVICPGFSVKDNIIVEANQAASGLFLVPGTDIRTLLLTGSEEYAAFQGGCLNLKLNLTGSGIPASVFRRDGLDYFLLEHSGEDAVLQAMALVSREVRNTITGAMIAADQLSRHKEDLSEKDQESVARLNRSLYRLLRLAGNLSDAGAEPEASCQEIRNIGRVVAEILEKARDLVSQAGIRLTYDEMPDQVMTLMDTALLERALLNILSNAIRFTPKGGTVHVSLTQTGSMLHLSVRDSGCGIGDNILGTLFRRYLRKSAPEDSRFGLGLGMVLIRSAAAAHGGTVLIDQPETGGTRVTLTLAIRHRSTPTLHSPIPRPDYAGERDHALLELSDCLPFELFS